MPEFLLVTSTLPTREQAKALGRQLVASRLAGCVQVAGPVTSTYRWQGVIETSEEWLLIAKTRQECWPELEREIRERHPYDVPEILATPLAAGSQPYLDWLSTESDASQDP